MGRHPRVWWLSEIRAQSSGANHGDIAAEDQRAAHIIDALSEPHYLATWHAEPIDTAFERLVRIAHFTSHQPVHKRRVAHRTNRLLAILSEAARTCREHRPAPCALRGDVAYFARG